MRSDYARTHLSKDDIVRKLAASTHHPVEEVQNVYERQLAKLEADAKVTAYIEVFAERLTREELKRRHH